MKKTAKLLFSIILIFTIALCSGCGKKTTKVTKTTSPKTTYKYEEQEVFAAGLTIKCRCKIVERKNNYPMCDDYFITDLGLEDLKNMTDGDFYNQFDNQITFFKKNRYYTILVLDRYANGDSIYGVVRDYSYIINEDPFTKDTLICEIPFPVIISSNTYCLSKCNYFAYNMQNKIDAKYKEYLRNYYENISSDSIKVNGNKITILSKIAGYPSAMMDNLIYVAEITINLDDVITMELKELIDTYPYYIPPMN